MSCVPSGKRVVIFKRAMLDWAMVFLAHVTKNYPMIGLSDHAETRCFPGSIGGTPRATAGVTQVAAVPQLLLRWKLALVPRRGAVAFPPESKW
jgi:hypothetical protein